MVAVECRPRGGAHDRRVRPANHVDARLGRPPRDYAEQPYRFGEDPHVRFRAPVGESSAAAHAARVQHLLVVGWRAQSGRPSGTQLGRRFGFSKQTFSRVVRGERWAGSVVFAALVHATTPTTAPPRHPASGDRRVAAPDPRAPQPPPRGPRPRRGARGGPAA